MRLRIYKSIQSTLKIEEILMKRIAKWIFILFIICFLSIIPITQNNFAFADKGNQSVYLGGSPLGVIAYSDGIIVTDYVEIVTENGVKCPAKDAGLFIGDIIKCIDNQKIMNAYDIKEALDQNYKNNAALEMQISRNDQLLKLKITPCKDLELKEYKLGILAKNDIAGVGTITYINPKNNRYGGLGHRIYDIKMPKVNIYNSGKVFPCAIIGVVKGTGGKAGELRGRFDKSQKMGTIDKNNDYGIYGYMNLNQKSINGMTLIEVGNRNSVKMGKAFIYTSIEGDTPKKYEIEIIKNVSQDSSAQKGLVLRVTDQRLLDTTGGIVQGMSGSPIVQDNKLIGAVTHVFINDPTKGYGVYIDWMIDN